jgi:outer membrane protein assembly factor BamE (lipoprotein component of BamABCDE complex)
LTGRTFKTGTNFVFSATTAVFLACAALTSCTTGAVMQSGFVADAETLALAPVGSSREQVILSLGSPSATATFDNEVFYYISQKRSRPVAFMKPKLIEQTVMAVYFDKDGVVADIKSYGLKEGKVFDMVSRTTPTGGRELTFLQQLLQGGTGIGKSAIQSAFGGTT